MWSHRLLESALIRSASLLKRRHGEVVNVFDVKIMWAHYLKNYVHWEIIYNKYGNIP